MYSCDGRAEFAAACPTILKKSFEYADLMVSYYKLLFALLQSQHWIFSPYLQML